MKMILATLTLFILSLFAVNAHAVSNTAGELSTHECVYDFAKDGGAIGNIDLCGTKALPVGTMILEAYYVVDAAFTSSGSATVSLGEAGTTAKYLALTAYNNAAYAEGIAKKVAIGVPFKIAVANNGKPSLSIAVEALTAGKLRMVFVTYKPQISSIR